MLDRPSGTHSLGITVSRSQGDELAAQSAAVARLRGARPVQGLSVRNWTLFDLQNRLNSPPAPEPGPTLTKVAVGSTTAATSDAKDPCNPPPPVTRNPDYDRVVEQREQLLSQAREKAAELDAASQKSASFLESGDTDGWRKAYEDETRVGGDLARLEREIQKLEATLYSQDAFVDPCHRESTRARNAEVRDALRLPAPLKLSLDAEAHRARLAGLGEATDAALRSGTREPGQSYYEDWIHGERAWHALPAREKRQWADTERRLLRDQDLRSLREWRLRADAESDRARERARADRRAQAEARYQAEDKAAEEAQAVAAKQRQAERERAALEARAAAAARQRAAAIEAAARDEHQARIARARDLEQQNRNLFTRLANLVGGFFVGGAQSCVEVVQTGLDGVGCGLRATGVADPGPKRSALGRLWDDSEGAGSFALNLVHGLGNLFVSAWQHFTDANPRALGEDLFNIGSLATPFAKGSPKAVVGASRAGETAATAAPAVARSTATIKPATFRRLSPVEQAQFLAGKADAVRASLLRHLDQRELAAFVEADGARAIAEASWGVFDSPDGNFTFLTRKGGRQVLGDSDADLPVSAGRSIVDDLPEPGAYSAKMTPADIEALFARTDRLTTEELLAKADLVRTGRAPRSSMDLETARAMFQVMVQHFRSVTGRMPTPAELQPLLDSVADAKLSKPAPAAAPFGLGPTGTIASGPLPRGAVPEWLASNGVDAGALPSALRRPPVQRRLPPPRPDISSMPTVHD
jgi:hypothetical protein